MKTIKYYLKAMIPFEIICLIVYLAFSIILKDLTYVALYIIIIIPTSVLTIITLMVCDYIKRKGRK